MMLLSDVYVSKRNFHRRQLKNSAKEKRKKDHLREAQDGIPYSTQPLLSVSMFDIGSSAELCSLWSA